MKALPLFQSSVASLAPPFIPGLHAQASPGTPAKQMIGKPAAGLSTMNVPVCHEAFSLPIAKAVELQRKRMTDEERDNELAAAGNPEHMPAR